MNNPPPAFTDTDTQQAYWFLGSLVDFRITGERTGGTLAVLEHRSELGYAPPVHRHLLADETVVILEGQMRADVGGESFTAGAGGALFLPRLIAHSFIVTSAEARYLTLHTPTGFDSFTREAGELDDGSGRPSQVPPSPEELRRIAAKHGIEIIGPPPRL